MIMTIGANKEMHPYQRTDKGYVPSGNLGSLYGDVDNRDCFAGLTKLAVSRSFGETIS